MNLLTPFFRSRRFGHRQLRAGQIVLIGLATWLTPSLIGALIIAFSAFGFEPNNFDNPWTVVATVGGLMLLAPLYGIFLVPIGLLLGAWAMRFGVAGWFSAIIAAVVTPLLLGVHFALSDPTTETWSGIAVFIPIVMVHAITMWIATRLISPAALLEDFPKI